MFLYCCEIAADSQQARLLIQFLDSNEALWVVDVAAALYVQHQIPDNPQLRSQ